MPFQSLPSYAHHTTQRCNRNYLVQPQLCECLEENRKCGDHEIFMVSESGGEKSTNQSTVDRLWTRNSKPLPARLLRA